MSAELLPPSFGLRDLGEAVPNYVDGYFGGAVAWFGGLPTLWTRERATMLGRLLFVRGPNPHQSRAWSSLAGG